MLTNLNSVFVSNKALTNSYIPCESSLDINFTDPEKCVG